MRKFGAFLVDDRPSKLHEALPRAADLEGAVTDPVSGVIRKDGTAVGVEIENGKRVGFPTPSRKLEFYSKTLRDWRWGSMRSPVTFEATSIGAKSIGPRARCCYCRPFGCPL